jgi:hypothetical protein
VPTQQIHLVSLGPVQNRISFECTNFSAMSQKLLSNIIRQAEKHLAQGVHPDDLEHLLGTDDFAVWEKEARRRWRLARPLQSIHGARGQRQGQNGWKSPMARGF